MRSIALALAATAALAGGVAAQHAGHQAADKPVATATAQIKGEGITGTATFSEIKHGTGSDDQRCQHQRDQPAGSPYSVSGRR